MIEGKPGRPGDSGRGVVAIRVDEGGRAGALIAAREVALAAEGASPAARRGEELAVVVEYTPGDGPAPRGD